MWCLEVQKGRTFVPNTEAAEDPVGVACAVSLHV